MTIKEELKIISDRFYEKALSSDSIEDYHKYMKESKKYDAMIAVYEWIDYPGGEDDE